MANEVLAEDIANHLRRDILRGTLAPGAPVKERDAAAQYGVSRTPMREAIRILAKDGLVILRAARSPIVADPSLREVNDEVLVLTALEELSGKLACDHATDEEISQICTIQARFIEMYETPNFDSLDLFELDMSFHLAIAKASHNPSLINTHSAYLSRLWRARYLSAIQRQSRELVVIQHGNIIEGLKSRDAAKTCAALDAHLKNMSTKIEHLFNTRSKDEAQVSK